MPVILLTVFMYLLTEYLLFAGFGHLLSWFFPEHMIPYLIFAEIVLSAVFGYRLLLQQRRESLKLFSAEPQAETLLKNLSLMTGGLLLMMPGILTDLAGIALIRGPGRKMLRKRMNRFDPDHGVFRFFYSGSGHSISFQQIKKDQGRQKQTPDDVIDIESGASQK